jgi:protein ImuB
MMRIVAVDAHALTLGIAPGLPLADARARLRDLAVFDHDPVGDSLWIEKLADACERYTPMVEIDAPDTLLLDISGCAHLFGGEDGLVADIQLRCGRLGMTLRIASAANPDAAYALAHYQSVPGHDETRSVLRLPVTALRVPEETEVALRRAGLKTIGDLASRPMAPLVARFGEETGSRLDRILGRCDSRISPRRPIAGIMVERRFAEPLGRVEDALGVIEALASEAATMLEERHQGGRRFEAQFFRTDGLVRRLAIETSLPSRDPALLRRLFDERIEALGDPIDPGFGFDLIRLAVPVTQSFPATQLRLESGSVAEGELATLLDRLSTRLGRGRVRRFAPRDTHIPEQGAFVFPALEGQAVCWPDPPPGDPPFRPLHLFDPPERIEVVAEVPDGSPHRFRWRRAMHEVAYSEGPERIAPEWWHKRPRPVLVTKSGSDEEELRFQLGDDPERTRDYYRIEDRRGRRFWIFRHGFYEPQKPIPAWYMHGLFA